MDCISELPDALRLQILSLLPLKSAIRTGALSSRWQGLWEQRWPEPSSLHILLPPGASRSRTSGAASTTRPHARSRGSRRGGGGTTRGQGMLTVHFPVGSRLLACLPVRGLNQSLFFLFSDMNVEYFPVFIYVIVDFFPIKSLLLYNFFL